MSHESEFNLVVLGSTNLANRFSSSVAEWIKGEPVEQNPYYRANSNKEMSALTRSDWAKYCIRELIEKSGINGLEFMAERYLAPERSNGPVSDERLFKKYVETHGFNEEFGYAFQSEYALIKEPLEAAFAIEEAVAWMLKNGRLLLDDYFDGYDEKEVLKAFMTSYATLSPTSDSFDYDGRGLHFLFCSLRTVGDLLKYAHVQGAMSGRVAAVFENRQMIPYGPNAGW